MRYRRPSRFGGGHGRLQYGSGPTQLSKASSEPEPTRSPAGARMHVPLGVEHNPAIACGLGIESVAANTP